MIFNMTSYNICISTPILDIGQTFYVIRACQLDETTRGLLTLYVKLEVRPDPSLLYSMRLLFNP
jgi:hypothetical protein